MRITDTGNIGIGTNDPGTYRCRIRGSDNNTFLRIETPNNLASEVSGIEFGIPAFTSAGSAKITSTTGIADVCNLQFHTSSGTNSSSVRMTILGNGRIGIGITDPNNILQVGSGARLRISNDNTDCSIIGTNNTDCIDNTRIVISGNNRSGSIGEIEYISTSTGAHRFINGGTERMRITNIGRVGIATNNPNNILQVGDGARLRISNGANDYTTIGTKDVDDTANTCIYIHGNTFSGNAGNISYFATTTTGRHAFFTDGSQAVGNTLATLSPDKCRFLKPLRSMNCQYENEGQQYPFSTGNINSGGTSLNGYFIPVNEYTNSLMVCAFSHDSTSYTYWRGHVSIGNNNQILNVINVSTANMTVEAFIQQTTLLQFIRVIPSVSFNSGVLLRVKICG